jgi:hypothetical protein
VPIAPPTALAGPTAAAPLPSPAPTAAAPTPVPPTARPAPTSEAHPLRPQAESARQAAADARSSSDDARARELAPTTYARGAALARDGERLLASGDDAGARKSFDSATRMFRQALVAAREAAANPPVAALQPTARPQPTAIPPFPTAVSVQPTAVPIPPTAAPPPALEATRIAPEERPAPTAAPAIRGNPVEERKIRDTIRLYEQAWSRFDAKLYERVYPSGVDAFEIAIRNLRSQYVNIEIRNIDVDAAGKSAVVGGNEVIVATPRAGTEQKTERDVVLRLQKQGDHWIIVSRN